MLGKGITALAIFLTLFTSAWWANGVNNRIVMNGEDPPINVQMLKVAEDGRGMYTPLDSYRPREYIKVGSRMY